MKRIFKYRLPRDGEVITITANVVKWLDIQSQDGWPVIWAVVDDVGYENEYEIAAWGTGWEFPDELNCCRYMGTAQDGAGYVWHYFMQEKPNSWSRAGTAIADMPVQSIDYWDTTPSICDDAESAISGLTLSSACTNAAVSIDALQEAIEQMTAAVARSNTAIARAYT